MPVDAFIVRKVLRDGEETVGNDGTSLMAGRGAHPIPAPRGRRLLGVIGRTNIVRGQSEHWLR